MSQRIFPIIGILALCLVIESFGTSAKEKNVKILDKLQGEWLSKTYIKNLNKTRSPMKAVGGYPTAFKISKNKDFYQWVQIYGFHESIHREIYNLIRIDKGNYYVIKHDRGMQGENDKFFIKDGEFINEITWIIEEKGTKKTLSFVKMKKDIEYFVNKIVLVGDYVDMEGQNFIFDESGKAQWPNKSFKYQINLDYQEVTCDSFTVVDEKHIMEYGFKWEDGKLLIFNLTEEALYCDKEPWVVLRPR